MMSLLAYLILLVAFLIIIFWPPRFLLNWLSNKYHVKFYFTRSLVDKAVYITIDDGPSPFTGKILQTLKALNVKATFFLIGDKIQQFPEVVQQIYADGHAIANHDITNRRSIGVATEQLMKDLITVNRMLEQSDRVKSDYFRPGCGYFSTKMVEMAEKLGMTVILGDVYPFDPFMPAWWMKFVLRHKTQDGSVIILHDGTNWRAEKLCDTLATVIPELKQQGYQFDRLPIRW